MRLLVSLSLAMLVAAPWSAAALPAWVTWHDDPSKEAVISWTSQSAEPGKLVWGPASSTRLADYPQAATSTAHEVEDDIWVHHVRATGLQPGSSVHFRVAGKDGTSENRWFRAAPEDAAPFTLLAGGDSRSDSTMRRVINRRIREIVADNPATLALAHGGDFIMTGSSWPQWQRWFADWEETVGEDGRVLPIIPTRGNHEGDGELYNIVFGFPGEPTADGDWWVTRIGRDFALVTLDSNASQSGVQREWLSATLRLLQGTRWIGVQYHRPAYPAVKSPGGALYHWVPIFEQYNVDFVLESDGHVLKRTVPIRENQPSPTGVVYLGEGGLGVPQRAPDTDRWYLQPPGVALSSHHVQLLTVHRDKITYTAVDPEGEVLDRYEFSPKRLGHSEGAAVTIRSLPVGPAPPPPDPPLFQCATTSSRAPWPTLLLVLVFALVRRRAWILAALAVCSSCGNDPCQDNIVVGDVRLHAVGDSVLWWNGTYCASIPDLVGLHLGGASVRNASVAGAHLTTNESPISSHRKQGDWDWVIVNGGGNDLNNCGCDEGCDAELRGLAAPDGTVGAMPRLVEQFTADGARVVLLGYYNVGPHAQYGFAACNDVFDEMDRRYALVAEQRDDVFFVDAGDVMKPDDERLYDLDFAHPSGPGSAVVAAHIAAVIDAASR